MYNLSNRISQIHGDTIMPLLLPNYISTLQVLHNEINGKYLILDNFEHKQIQDVEQLKFIQGTLGTHIMDIGAMYWTGTLQCPIFIFESAAGQIESPLDLVISAIYDPLFTLYYSRTFPYTIIMESASIVVSESGVTCTVQLLSDNDLVPNLYKLSTENAFENNLIGRVAKFYDTKMKIGGIDSFILSGTINIKANIVKNYFLDDTSFQWPYLAVTGYDISGDVKVGYNMVEEENSNLFIGIDRQLNNIFSYQANSLYLSFGSSNNGAAPYIIDFKTPSIYNLVNKTINPKGIVNANVEFQTYAPRGIAS
jgi:hypothetical protein